MIEDYKIDWSFVANTDPYTHADFTVAYGVFEITSGNLKPSNNWQDSKFCFTGVAVDRSKNRMVARVVLGIGPTEYSDIGGPAFFVPSGTDIGRGYWLRHSGNELRLYKVDTETGSGAWAYTFGNINTVTGADAATGGELDLELDNIDTTATMRAYYDGTQIGGTYNPTTYIPSIALVPSLHAVWNGTNLRGWTGFSAEGLALGGFRLDDVNGDDIIDSASGFVINGDFSNVTITSVKIKQTGAADKTVSFTETDTELTCTAIDFHTTAIFPGDVTIEVTDGTDTLTLAATVDFPTWSEVVALSIVTNGVFKDIAAAAAGDLWHYTTPLAGSDITVNADGVLAVFTPAVAQGTTATWWHGDVSSNTWTVITATINQEDLAGPSWATAPAWDVTEGRTATYDMGALATTSGGTVDSFAIAPAVSGFTISATTGLVTFDGTAAPGQYWLNVSAADDNGTTSAPQLGVTVAADPLTLSNHRETSITQTTATITVDAVSPVGDIYLAVRDSGPYTDAANIKAGTGAGFANNRPGALSVQFYPTGLIANTLYYYSMVQADGADDSNIVSGTFTTQSDITYTETGKAPAPRPY